MASEKPETPVNKKPLRIGKANLIMLIAFGVVGLVAGALLFNLVRTYVRSWSMTNLPGAPIGSIGGEPTLISGTAPVPTLNTSIGATTVAWDGKSRVTILVMGLDYDDTAERRTPRSDSMILFSMDPIANTAGMLSIPRDLWVQIPGFEYARINTAYYLGEAYNVPPEGGPTLAVETVEQVIGVPINYYAVIDFDAFVKFIDTLGGLDMYIREEIVVDPIGPNNTVTLYPGVQNLSGAVVLGYARNRHTAGGDEDRSRRQQEVIMAIREQILQWNMLPTLAANAPQLYSDLSSGIRTNMTLDEIVRLATLAANVPTENIKQGVIGVEQVLFGTTPDGTQAILIPIYDKIRLLRDDIFATGGAAAPIAIGGDTAALVAAEGARIVVQNGSQVPDLATRTGNYLIGLGMNVIGENPPDQAYAATQMILYNGKPYTAAYLAGLMNISTANIFMVYTPDASADIQIIVGNDWANNNTVP